MSPRRASLVLACLLSVFPHEIAAAAEPARTDAHGDPLPPGALLRLGTVRWRACARYLAFTPDGKTLVTGEYIGHDGVVRCLDAATGKEDGSFRVPDGITAFALSPDGKTLALGLGPSKGIVFVRLHDGKEIRRFEEASTYFTRMDFSPDGKTLAAVGADSVVRLFDVETEKTILHRTGFGVNCFPTGFSPDGKRLAFIDEGNTLRIVEIAAGKEVFAQEGRQSDGRLLNMSFSPDGKKVAWIGDDAQTFALWDVAAGAPVIQFRGPSDSVESVHFSPDGKHIAATYSGGLKDGAIRVWDAATGKEVREFVATCNASDEAVFSPDGKRLAAAGEGDGVVHLWDVETGKELSRAGEHQGLVCSAVFAPDGRTVLTGCADQSVRAWDANRGAVLRRIEVGGGGGNPYMPRNYHIAFSNDRKVAAVTDWHHEADLWDVDLGKERPPLEGGEAIIWKVAFAPDDRTAASSGPGQGGLLLWDAQTGKRTYRIDIGDSGVPSFAFSPDGKTLAVERDDRKVSWAVEMSLWDVARAKEIRTWSRFHRGRLGDVLFSPDGKAVAAGEGKEVELWEAATGKELPTLRAPRGAPAVGRLAGLAFSPDGRTLAAGGESGAIYLWEVGTAKVRAVFTGHRAPVTSLDFSADGARLLSGSHDTTALIWDLTGLAAEGKPAKSLTAEEQSAAWDELADADAGKAYRAGWRLASDPEASVPFLQKHLRPAEFDAADVGRALASLDSNDFDEREAASRRLAALGDLAGPAVRKALENGPSSEARRRLEELTRKLDGPVEAPEQARALRCVEALEHIGSAEARLLLDDLAKGAKGRLTSDAKASMARMTKTASDR